MVSSVLPGTGRFGSSLALGRTSSPLVDLVVDPSSMNYFSSLSPFATLAKAVLVRSGISKQCVDLHGNPAIRNRFPELPDVN